MVHRVQVLAEPEPLQRLHPGRHQQAVGVAVAGRLLVGQMRAVGEPVDGEEGADQIAPEQQRAGAFARDQREEQHAPADRQAELGEVADALAPRRGRPVAAEQIGVLHPEQMEAAEHERQQAVAHVAHDVVRVLVRLVRVAVMVEVLDAMRRIRNRDQRRDEVAAEIVQPLQPLAAAVDVAVRGLVQRRVREVGQHGVDRQRSRERQCAGREQPEVGDDTSQHERDQRHRRPGDRACIFAGSRNRLPVQYFQILLHRRVSPECQ